MSSKDGPRRVVHVIAPAHTGGAESVVVALAAADPMNTAVILIDQVGRDSDTALPMAMRLSAMGVAVRAVRCGRRRYWREVRELVHELGSLQASVVHTHGYHADIVGYIAGRRAGVSCVATAHGYLGRDARERVYDAIDRWFLKRFDAVIAVSDALRDRLVAAGCLPDRTVVIQNGLTPSRFLNREDARRCLGLPLDGFCVGWVGRMSAEKGPDLFVRTFAALRSSVVGVMIGDGAEMNRVRLLVDECGLNSDRQGKRIVLSGSQSNAGAVMPAFDLLVVSSRSEGTPMVILEAVAAGVAVAAFTVGGIPEVLSPATAFLAPPEDTERLAAQIDAAGSDSNERARRARAAAADLSGRLSLTKWHGQVQVVYDEVTKRRLPIHRTAR